MPKTWRTNWQPVAVMAIVISLGLWIAMGPGSTPKFSLDPTASMSKVRIGETRGVLEAFRRVDGTSPGVCFRLWLSDGPTAPPIMSRSEAEALLGPTLVNRCLSKRNWLFQVLNITNWTNLVWIGIGFFGQFIFSGRMILQWVISEKHKKSVVTESFWWFSLIGGVTLFAYFVWRQDPVPMIGQATGIVVYARNIHLFRKQSSIDA